MDKKFLKKLWDTTTTVIVVIFVIAAIFLMGSRLLGYEVYNVISGSMEPTYSKGDLIYVKAVNPTEIRVGDPITFVANEQLVVATHRVVRIDAQNRCFYTKGDANETEDQRPVRFENVKGVPQFSLPLLGYVSDYIASPPGSYVAVGIVVLLMAVAFLPDIFSKDGKKDAPTDNKKSATPETADEAASEAVEITPDQQNQEE